MHYEDCLDRTAAFEHDPWWVFRLDDGWGSFSPLVRSFAHDPTWTSLEWKLVPVAAAVPLVLPMAATGRWIAEVDGHTIVPREEDDSLIALDLPPRSEVLRLRYTGPPGEWSSVVVSLAGLILGIVLIVRNGRQRTRPAA